MTDRVQVSPRPRGDVQEPHRSPRVRGASDHVTDDAHGPEIQLAQRPIPRRHLGEVIAQSPRAVALPTFVMAVGDLDVQTRSRWHSHGVYSSPDPTGGRL